MAFDGEAGMNDPGEIARLSGAAFAKLVEIMQKLRAPGGCPWDR